MARNRRRSRRERGFLRFCVSDRRDHENEIRRKETRGFISCITLDECSQRSISHLRETISETTPDTNLVAWVISEILGD